MVQIRLQKGVSLASRAAPSALTQHIALHNSEREALRRHVPGFAESHAQRHARGDRVHKKICEKTLKSFDHYAAQNNGRHVFTNCLEGRLDAGLSKPPSCCGTMQANTRFRISGAGRATTASVCSARRPSGLPNNFVKTCRPLFARHNDQKILIAFSQDFFL